MRLNLNSIRVYGCILSESGQEVSSASTFIFSTMFISGLLNGVVWGESPAAVENLSYLESEECAVRIMSLILFA